MSFQDVGDTPSRQLLSEKLLYEKVQFGEVLPNAHSTSNV